MIPGMILWAVNFPKFQVCSEGGLESELSELEKEGVGLEGTLRGRSNRAELKEGEGSSDSAGLKMKR